MSWNSCKTCVFVSRTSYTSALFKVLLTLKLLHGSRSGGKGATLEDIAMHMIKHFCLDGDIKSQVLASLKYGVKMHFIQKNKDRFSLILPASSIHLAPCKFKNEETERIQCIFPPKWDSSCASSDPCSMHGDKSCCGRSKHKRKKICCHQNSDEESEESDPCDVCKQKSDACRQKKSDPCDFCKQKQSNVCKPRTYKEPTCSTCSPCSPCSSCGQSDAGRRPKKRKRQCATTMPSACSRNKKHKPSCDEDESEDYCLMCPPSDEDENVTYKYDAPKNCRCCSS